MPSMSFPNVPGIYRITCIATGKFYIGSAVNLRKRRAHHLRTLSLQKHFNPKLQNAWNKYGKDAFIIDILELVLLPEMLTTREQYWFKTLQPFGKKGFNIATVAGSTLGMPAHNRGKKATPEQIEKNRLSHLGIKQSEETRRKRATSHKGQKRTPETREKMRLAALGHAPTNARTFLVTSPDGIEYIVRDGLPKFCREHQLHSSALREVAAGVRTHHKRWQARYLDEGID